MVWYSLIIAPFLPCSASVRATRCAGPAGGLPWTVSLQVIVSLIGTTKTATGLTVQAALDTNAYPVGVKVTEEQYATINLHRADFHGDWNYTITPH